MNNQYGLAGKVAVVTGAAAGIGFAIASSLAKSGAAILVADIAEHSPEKAREIADTYGVRADAYIGDLSKKENCMDMVQKAIDNWGVVDILVNNAGGGVIAPFLEHTQETMETTMNRNLWPTVWGCHSVLPYMVKQGRGRIINIGADSIRNGLWNHAGYNAAKGGVHGITTGLAREFASYDITVNCVAPSTVLTERKIQKDNLRKINDDLRQKFTNIIPKGRPANMDEVTSTVCFLASDEASFITGQVISVNGGSTML